MTATDLYNDLIAHGFSLSVQGGNLILSPSSQLSQLQRAEIKQHKSELLLLLAANDPHPKGETQPVLQVATQKANHGIITAWFEKYASCVTCNQCEHLSLTGSCTRLGKRVLPQALRECESFNPLKSERISPVEAKPYTHAELERLLNQAAKPLYYHLIDCEQCNLEDMRYCVDCFTIGNTFDCLLLCFDDAANKRYLLMNQVIKARVSRRREFVPLSSDNAPPPPTNAPIARKYGNTIEYEAFINHWTACKVCKPNLGRYCSEGQKLEKEVNS